MVSKAGPGMYTDGNRPTAEKERQKSTNGRYVQTEIDQWQRSTDINQPKAEKKSRNLNYDADFGTIFRLVSVSKEGGTILYYFSL